MKAKCFKAPTDVRPPRKVVLSLERKKKEEKKVLQIKKRNIFSE